MLTCTDGYAYGNQPQIGLWNLARLAEALLPLIPEAELQAGLEFYGDTYQKAFTGALAAKLGLTSIDEDMELVTEMFRLMNAVETDFTLFFRGLAAVRGSTWAHVGRA
jgi:uncharacterized protein YdiU (UPF0061 family)